MVLVPLVMCECLCAAPAASRPFPSVAARLVDAKKIWDRSPHNAFTDLARWRDRFYVAFREGRAHVSSDGKVRVLSSADGNEWSSVGLVELAGYDLRDAHVAVTPDGRLMLLGGAAPRKTDNEMAPTGTFVSFSRDGVAWTAPVIVVEPGRWLWRVTWHKGVAYGFAYHHGARNGIDLLTSADGAAFAPLVPLLLEGKDDEPNEAALVFTADDVCHALVRRDGKKNSALLGTSAAPYVKWEWKDLGAHLGGPNLIRLPSGEWIGAGRVVAGDVRTGLVQIDVGSGAMREILRLPSGGDSSYPGLVWHNGLLHVSYYSSHEGKTSIYFARVKIESAALR